MLHSTQLMQSRELVPGVRPQPSYAAAKSPKLQLTLPSRVSDLRLGSSTWVKVYPAD